MTDRIRASDLKAALGKHKRKQVDHERPIHIACLNYLKFALPGAVIHHSPNEMDLGGDKAAKARAQNRAKALGMRTGWPDIEVIWRGQFWTFEVKAEKGRLTDEQGIVGEQIIAAGGRWSVVRSLDDIKRLVSEWQSAMAEPSVAIPHRGVIG